MQCGLKRTQTISTIGLNKKKNDKNEPVGVFNSAFRFGKLRDSSLADFLVFAALYRKIVENIDQMHENPFFYCSFSEMDLMASSIWSRGKNCYFSILTVPINVR